MTNETDAKTILRLAFELVGADVHPTPGLLADLLGLSRTRVDAEIARLRRSGFLQDEGLRVTMAGLALAASTPEVELAEVGGVVAVAVAAA